MKSRGDDSRASRSTIALVVAGVAVAILAGYSLRQPPSPASGLASAPASLATPTATPALVLPEGPHLLILGDSFTAGVGATDPKKGYAYLAADRLGWDNRVNGSGGSGYTNPGPTGTDEHYAVRIRQVLAGDWKPNVVILQGGLNDYKASEQQLSAAFSADVSMLRKALPQVRIVAFGPVASAKNNTSTATIDQELSSVAASEDVPYISPIQDDWITEENSDRYIGDDGYHPTDAGHAYLARRLVAALKALERA